MYSRRDIVTNATSYGLSTGGGTTSRTNPDVGSRSSPLLTGSKVIHRVKRFQHFLRPVPYDCVITEHLPPTNRRVVGSIPAGAPMNQRVGRTISR